MALTNMQVFNQWYAPAIYESLAQKINAFNEASGGAIQLVAASNAGDFLQTSIYSTLAAAMTRVDRYAANNARSATALSQYLENMVKVAGGATVGFEKSQMTWLDKPTAEAVEVISRQFAELVMQDMLNTAIKAGVAAIENQATAKVDVSGGASISQRTINASHRLFGDASGSLVATVMTGSMYHQILDKNLQNAQELYSSDNVTVVSILGKRIVVTDAPALVVAGAPNKDKVLSLSAGGLIVRDPSNPIIVVQDITGYGRIKTEMQMDYDFTIGVKGYSWDSANGGKSPTDAEIATGSNWDLATTSIKNTAGVIAIGDEAVI